MKLGCENFMCHISMFLAHAVKTYIAVYLQYSSLAQDTNCIIQ